MSLITSSINPTVLARANLSLSATASLTVEKTLKAKANLSFSVLANLSQTNFLQGTASLSLNSSGFLRIDDEPNLFLQGNSNIGLSANLNLAATKILQAQAVINLTASGNLSNSAAERADALFQVQIVPVTASANYQKYDVKFSADDTEIKIRAFRLEYPAKSIGCKFNVELSNPVRNQFSANTSFKFEIKIGADWFTLLDTAKLDSESISSRFFDDRVSLDISAPIDEKIALSPRKTTIYYDPLKTEVEIDETDILRDTDGNEFEIQTTAVSDLSLYYLLNKAFVEGCGFASVVTNIPDYKITRADFSTGASFKDSVAGFIGMFDPVYFEADNKIYILDTTNALPAGFSPRTLTASKFANFNSNAQKRALIDGYDVNFVDSEGEYYTQRIENKTEPGGIFGTPDYTEIRIEKVFRDYRSVVNPSVVLRTEQQSETRTTYNSAVIVTNVENEVRSFNSSGRLTQITKTISARVPNLNDNGNPLLQTLRQEIVIPTYRPNPKSPRQVLHKKTKTFVSGLIAVDAANPQFNAPFEQDYMIAFDNGNLRANMSSRFGTLYTITDTFEEDGKGQTDVRREVFSHLRGAVIDPQTDLRGGLNAFNQFQQSRRVRVWRIGADREAEKGGKFQSLSGGELSLPLLIALANRRLIKQTEKNQAGNFDLIGVDLSLRRGVSVRILDRWQNAFGNFLIEALIMSGQVGETNSIETQITATEI